ncbi:LPS export ABC transporter permease LptF [Chitinibacter bivalviorum]|uniref:Lipopolysaccharide export system permease protein LptF n=1 Tax=Chitinibacter bivalviorum TaxID=2739434 RepID=A0A7H9BMI8_9NEIS|nr:LPS export ABC transporter permease LptF [Chitinibacter bivalviorum]QLG89652.1 LPS export ABC transporter permease LptF [Chitinibacter bivalviorum]
MLFRKTLIHEMTWMAFALFIVLLLIVMTSQIVRLLGEAALGALASSAVWAVMGFTATRYLPLLFSLMLFVTILSVITRLWKDHEMFVWFAAGRSIHSFIPPVLMMGLPVVALIGLLSMGVSPWAQQKGKEYRETSLKNQEVTQVAPGVFRESRGADRIYFIENFSPERGFGENVFLQIRRDGKLTTILADTGGMQVDEHGDRWMWLKNAAAYQAKAGSAQYDILNFQEGKVRIDKPSKPEVDRATNALSTRALLVERTPQKWAELHWRMALPIQALILMLAAIPLAFANPRGGRSFHILFAALFAFSYYNAINVFQAWIAAGKIPGGIGMWPLHVMAAAITVGLYAWRSKVRG